MPARTPTLVSTPSHRCRSRGRPLRGMGSLLLAFICLHLFPFAVATANAQLAPADAQKLYDRVTPSLVAVKFTFDSELGRQELIGSGIVVRDDGLVMTSLAVFDPRIPDNQMKDFKIVIPRQDQDNDEIDATFVGRDERSNVAFVKPKEASSDRKWTPIEFVDVPVNVGDTVVSIGLLPEGAGFKTYLMQSSAAANLRGETPQVLVTAGGLAAIGSPVFNAGGQAIGSVNVQPSQTPFLNDPQNALAGIISPPKFFVPARDFLLSLREPPTPGQPLKLPWIGIPQLAGLKKDVADFFGLKNQPAIQIGDVISGTPAEKAGLQRGWIIVKVNDQPLERGDQPEELPGILRKQILRMHVGDVVTLTILPGKDQPLKEVQIKLEEQPERPNTAERYWAEDLGFSVREMVFLDRYARKLASDNGGVVVGLIKPQSAADAAGLQGNDLIVELNRQPIKDLRQFQTEYESFRKENPKQAVVLVVIRDARTETVRIEPPQ